MWLQDEQKGPAGPSQSLVSVFPPSFLWPTELSLADLVFTVLPVPRPRTIQFRVLRWCRQFCYFLAPANPSFSPKTQKVVCSDCSSTEGMLLLCLLPEGCSLFCVSRRPFKTAARALDLLLHGYAKNPQPVFLFHLIPTG